MYVLYILCIWYILYVYTSVFLCSSFIGKFYFCYYFFKKLKSVVEKKIRSFVKKAENTIDSNKNSTTKYTYYFENDKTCYLHIEYEENC